MILKICSTTYEKYKDRGQDRDHVDQFINYLYQNFGVHTRQSIILSGPNDPIEIILANKFIIFIFTVFDYGLAFRLCCYLVNKKVHFNEWYNNIKFLTKIITSYHFFLIVNRIKIKFRKNSDYGE